MWVRLFLGVSILLVCILGWQLHSASQRETNLQTALKRSEAHARNLEKQIVELTAQIEDLEKKSVGNVVKKANRALLKGWESLVDIVEDEIEKVQEQIEQELEQHNKNGSQGKHHHHNGAQNKYNPADEKPRFKST